MIIRCNPLTAEKLVERQMKLKRQMKLLRDLVMVVFFSGVRVHVKRTGALSAEVFFIHKVPQNHTV